MRRSHSFLPLVLALASCKAESAAPHPQLDSLLQRLEAVESKLAAASKAAPTPRAPRQPDPQQVYALRVDGDPVVGPADAKVTIVESYRFSCGWCERVTPTVEQILEEYGDQVRVVYKNLATENDEPAALAVCAADAQGEAESMMKAIWKSSVGARDYRPETLAALAEGAGLDMRRYRADVAGPRCAEQLARNRAELARFSALGTPWFFVNGRSLRGAKPYEQFKALIDAELAKAEERIAQGASPASYYRDFVIEPGKKSL